MTKHCHCNNNNTNQNQHNNHQSFSRIIRHTVLLSSILVSLHSQITEGLASTSSSSPSAASQLRNLCLSSRKTSSAIVLPGVHDALSARIFADSGAKVLFLSGFGVTASRLGNPDAGLLTQTEMEDATKSVVSALTSLPSSSSPAATEDDNDGVVTPPVPLMVDGDTGYGGAANIRRTIRGLANAGAAAITIEDQTFPKKCTYAAGTGVSTVPRPESIARIRAAIAARDEAKYLDGRDVLLVARTDCRLERGFEEVLERCKLYEALGADIVYAENLQSRQEYEMLRKNLKDEGTITMLAQLQLEPISSSDKQQKQRGAPYTVEDVRDMGYDLALFGVTGLQSTVGALQGVAQEFLANGGIVSSEKEVAHMASFDEVKRVVGFPELDEFESRYYHE